MPPPLEELPSFDDATVAESANDSASGPASVSAPALSKELRYNSSCESSDWSIVVNGTRYLGHLRSGGGSVSESEDTDHAVTSLVQESTKERNRRLLIRDRLIQAEYNKSRGRRRPSKRSKQMETFRPIEKEQFTDKGGRSTASDEVGGQDDVLSAVDETTTRARQREGNVFSEGRLDCCLVASELGVRFVRGSIREVSRERGGSVGAIQ